jgi:protein-tyrosine phosphatase
MMNNIYSYIASYFRIIPMKTIDTIYNYYYGTRALPAIRMEKLPKIYSVLNHVTSLGLEPTEIIPGIFLGNAYNANNYSTLNYYKIKTIVNVSKEIPNAFESNFDYYRIPINDDSENHISEFINSTLDFLNNKSIDKDNAVLIHCYMGSSRSASIVLIYLITKYNYDFESALKLIKLKRPIVNINNNFIEDIKKYLEKENCI